MRRLLCCLLPIACCLLSSCSSSSDLCIFGYTTQSQFSSDIRTVRVPIFKNRTFIKGIEFQLTEAVQKQIEARSPWKVVGCEQDADTELLGTVVAVGKHNTLVNPLNEIRQGEMTVGVQILWRDLRTGEILSKAAEPPPLPAPPVPEGTRTPAPTPLFVAEGGMLVLRSSSFVPELGESTSSARKQVVDDLAKQIVNMMEVPW
jgi:hypothetical protein